ncbi:MAG: M16 family metallopeptidase, partial [Asticcacaulis sp.]
MTTLGKRTRDLGRALTKRTHNTKAILFAFTALCALPLTGQVKAEAAGAPKLAAAGQATAVQTKASAPLKVAPLTPTFRQLPNGLKVYALRDTSTATVSVHVWYDVGSKDDPKGRSGFAHLFEHIMFKSTKNLPNETFDRLTEDVGGMNNASTADDYTNYFEMVPAHHLERILFGEADRMGSLVIDEDVFKSERDVVKEEYRQRILASPYGKIFGLYLPMTSYSVHPYARPGIGSIEELDAATVADVRAFHAAYYRPDNAVLVVAGNFDPAQLDRWIDQYFGPIKTPKRAIPRVSVREPARTTAKSLTVYEPNVPLPAVVLNYQGPDARSPDLAAFRVLEAILSRGDNSRLYKSLVYDQQIAASTFTSFDLAKEAGALTFAAILSGGKSPDEGMKALKAEVDRLKTSLVSEAELAEARNELLAETLEGRETAFNRAFELANSVILYGDPKRADSLLADIQKVTAADIQRVAKTWFDHGKAVEIRYLPEAMKPANGKSDTIAL